MFRSFTFDQVADVGSCCAMTYLERKELQVATQHKHSWNGWNVLLEKMNPRLQRKHHKNPPKKRWNCGVKLRKSVMTDKCIKYRTCQEQSYYRKARIKHAHTIPYQPTAKMTRHSQSCKKTALKRQDRFVFGASHFQLFWATDGHKGRRVFSVFVDPLAKSSIYVVLACVPLSCFISLLCIFAQ